MLNMRVVGGAVEASTLGHMWLIRAAAGMIAPNGKLHVVIGVNSAKKGYFSREEREAQVKAVLYNTLPSAVFQSIVVESISDELLIHHAMKIGASYIFRGIRNTEDFNYESQIQQVNRKINPNVETVFFIPPAAMSEVSSSTVKGLVGFQGWERIVEQYVDPIIVDEFKKKLVK